MIASRDPLYNVDYKYNRAMLGAISLMEKYNWLCDANSCGHFWDFDEIVMVRINGNNLTCAIACRSCITSISAHIEEEKTKRWLIFKTYYLLAGRDIAMYASDYWTYDVGKMTDVAVGINWQSAPAMYSI